MLPEDTKERRQALTDQTLRQSAVEDHFKPATPEDKPIPYSDELFKEAAIEWLIETNQVSCHFDYSVRKLTQSSRFKHSNTPSSRRWWMLLLVPPVELSIHHVIKHDKQLLLCSSGK
jgi:hypothetical protein